MVLLALNGNAQPKEKMLILLQNFFYDIPKLDPDSNATIVPSDAEIIPEPIAQKYWSIQLHQLNADSLTKIGIPQKYYDAILGVKGDNGKGNGNGNGNSNGNSNNKSAATNGISTNTPQKLKKQ